MNGKIHNIQSSVGAMKIARNVAVSGRHGEWYPPFVGAMKIARNLAVSARPVEWHPPIPGSLSEGAGSEAD